MADYRILIYLNRTGAGFALKRVVGANPDAARVAGLDVDRTRLATMLWSGALCGLAGAVELSGVVGTLYENYAPGYGFAAVAVALLGRLEPLRHHRVRPLLRRIWPPVPAAWSVHGGRLGQSLVCPASRDAFGAYWASNGCAGSGALSAEPLERTGGNPCLTPCCRVSALRKRRKPYLRSVGTVFAEFGEQTQDSGNISYGVQIGEERFFVKTAGVPDDPRPYLDHPARAALLRNAVRLNAAVRHPLLPALSAVIESPDGPLLVYPWLDGELLGVPREQRDDPAFVVPAVPQPAPPNTIL